MKRIRLLILLFYVSAVAFQGTARAQMIVTDPSLEAVNITGFTKDLGNGIEQLQTFLQNLNVAKEQLAKLQEARDLLTKVGNWTALLDRAQSSIRLTVSCIDNISTGVQALSDKEFSAAEVQYALQFFNSSLAGVNGCIKNVTSLISDASSLAGKDVKLDPSQRKAELEKEEADIRAYMERTGIMNEYINDKRYVRKLARESLKMNGGQAGELSDRNHSLLAMSMPSDPSRENGLMELLGSYDPSKVNPGIEWNFNTADIKKGLQEQGLSEGSKKGATAAKKAYSKTTNAAVNLFYAISALCGVIGMVRCYTKWNLGENIAKTAFIWFGTTLCIVTIGFVVRLFFS